MSPLQSKILTCPEPTSVVMDPVAGQLVTLATCGASVAVERSYDVRSTEGPLLSLRIRCLASRGRHMFHGLIGNLWTCDQLRIAAGERLDKDSLAQRNELLELLRKVIEVGGLDAELLKFQYEDLLQRFAGHNEIFPLEFWDILLRYVAKNFEPNALR